MSDRATSSTGRAECYRCHKPQLTCICRHVRRVPNRTPVWIVQHPRERFHPIGTARILDLGLEQVHISVCHRPSAEPPKGLPKGAALLFPGATSETHPFAAPQSSDESLPPHVSPLQVSSPPHVSPLQASSPPHASSPSLIEPVHEPPPPLADQPSPAPPAAPRALVVLDGTWPHARTLYRQNEWLHALPRYRLQPRAPSRYRIRREPAAHCVSTVEAVVEALSCLEPDNHALVGLLDAFEKMIDEQIRLLQARRTDRRRPQKKRIRRPPIPRLLTEAAQRLVLVYAETRADCRAPSRPRQLVQWCALRPASGAVFDRVLQTDPTALVPRHLEHMLLAPADLQSGVTLAELRSAWEAFRKPEDLLLSWNACSPKLLRDVMGLSDEHLLLQTIYCNWRRRRSGTLEDVLTREQLQPLPVSVRGRARLRLGNAAALLAHLQSATHTLAAATP